MDYFVEFTADQSAMSVDTASSVPFTPHASGFSFRPNDSNASLQLSDLEDLSCSRNVTQRSPPQTETANPGGMWQAINKRGSIHEEQRPAKRSRGTCGEQRDSNQAGLYQPQGRWDMSLRPNSQTAGAPRR